MLLSPLVWPVRSGVPQVRPGTPGLVCGRVPGQQVAELRQPDVDAAVIHLAVKRGEAKTEDWGREGLPCIGRIDVEPVLEPVRRIDLADRVAQVGCMGPAVAQASARQVAGRVQRDPAVEADDHEREEGFIELALRVAAGWIAQVDPDRVGLAVAVVVHVVGDLTVGARDKVGERRRVVAVGLPRAEDP